MSKELIVIQDYEEKAVELFENNDVEKVVQKIIKEAGSLVFDVDSEKGRKELKQHVAKIKKSSKLLDGIGKDHVTELKAKPKIVDKHRKAARDSLEAFADKTEKPLIDWEAAEKKRFDDISARINDIDPFLGGIVTITVGDYSTDELKAMAEKASLFVVDETLEEQQKRGAMVKEDVLLKLSGLIANQMQAELEAAELERLRQEAAAREQQEREERIAKDAKEAAEREAEEIAKALEITMALEAQKIEKEKQAAIDAQKAAEQAVIDAKAKAEQDAKNAVIKAKADAEQAVIDEQNRVKAEQEREKAAAEKREANTKHNAKINNAAVKAIKAALMPCKSGEFDDYAKAIVVAIAKKQIPNVTITY